MTNIKYQYLCSRCGVSLLRDEAWTPDNKGDQRVFCNVHATDDCIRLKDLSESISERKARLEQEKGEK